MHINRNIIQLASLGILFAGYILQAETREVLKNPILEIERVLSPITIDGDLTDLEWGQAKGTDYFVEIDPGDNVEPSEKTAVKVTYDDHNLLCGFLGLFRSKDDQDILPEP